MADRKSYRRRLLSSLGQSANRTLGRFGMRLEVLQYDLDERPIDGHTTQRIHAAMAEAYSHWLAQQRLFVDAHKFDVERTIADFITEWLLSHFREQHGGSRLNNLLWLHLIAKSLKPALIIDSGTFKGASAWAMSLGSPESRAYSFDIDLRHLALRHPGVNYVQADWAEYGLDIPREGRVLAYFDDHVDQVRRLIEASRKGIDFAVFDDDFPVTSFYSMAPSPSVLPKIEFALDDHLTDGQELVWQSRTGRQSYRIDRSYLDRGRACIAVTERLPNTSLVTGIHQTPYRIVKLHRSHGQGMPE